MEGMTADGPSQGYRGGPDRHRKGSRSSDGYGGSSGLRSNAPYDRNGSSGYRPREGRVRRLEDVLDSDELLSNEQYSKYSELEAGTSLTYIDYVRKHRRLALERFFGRHKNEAWFVEKYDPFKSEGILASEKEKVNKRVEQFYTDLKEGKYAELSLTDGADLSVEGETNSSMPFLAGGKSVKTFPSSMKLPNRLACSTEKRGNVIALSNISPMVSKEELEAMLRECSPHFISLELTEPMVEKTNYRLGWAVFEPAAEQLAPIVTAIEERILHGEKIYCSGQKSYSLQIKLVDPAFSSAERISVDLKHAQSLMETLDTFYGMESQQQQQQQQQLLFEEQTEETKKLDLIILYLRKVYFVDYYSASFGAGPYDIARLAGDLRVRSSPSSEADATTNLSYFDEMIKDLGEKLTHKYEPFNEDYSMEKHVAKVDEGRYRCSHCSKLFKGVDFVIKHIRLKHEDVAKSVTIETISLNAFLARPIASTILSIPLTSNNNGHHQHQNYQSTRTFSSANERSYQREGNSRDYHRERNGYYGRDRADRGGRRLPPPPPTPKDAVADPRKIRQYVDWDAPATGDAMEINYD